VINEHQNILEWNPKAEAIFGYMAEEVLGKQLSETIIPLQYREAHKRGMAHFLKTGEGPVLNKTIEITALHKNGKEFYVNLSISNVRLEGEWLFIAFLSDISERKKTEEALIYKEAELLQSKYLEDKKDEFISIASHELKTPLTTIKAYTQIALSCCDNVPEKVNEYLIKIDKYTDKLHDLINEMLDVSKIQAGKLQLSTSPVELNLFLDEALNSIQHITADHQILLKENVSAKVNIDPLRIEQVITNIISNAAKYSPGKHKIVVSSQIKNDLVVVSFKDFGIGIPQQKLDQVFTRFYRVNEDAVQFSGLGIGLYISAEIIKQHGGKIWAESTEGEGSIFHFSLPLQN
jgi:PAS domain S-box-containing protein